MRSAGLQTKTQLEWGNNSVNYFSTMPLINQPFLVGAFSFKGTDYYSGKFFFRQTTECMRSGHFFYRTTNLLDRQAETHLS